MKKFIAWLKRLFAKKVKVVVVQNAHEKQVVFSPKVIKVTSGKRHVWVETRHGVIRKPIGVIK